MTTTTPQDNKKHYYTLLQLGKTQLGWDDEFYYEVWLPQQGAQKKNGRYSATTLSLRQLAKAVAVMKTLGFKVKSTRKYAHDNPDWRRPRIDKLTAIWCTLADAGVVTSREQTALEHWCSRYTKKDRLQWATSNDLNRCIEALKQWAKRSGVDIPDESV